MEAVSASGCVPSGSIPDSSCVQAARPSTEASVVYNKKCRFILYRFYLFFTRVGGVSASVVSHIYLLSAPRAVFIASVAVCQVWVVPSIL